VLSGAIEFLQGAFVRATILAPRANVIFGSDSRIEGSVFASSVTMMPGSSAVYHRDCDPVIDGNCDGAPDCPVR
jgi:hypothetical protein